MIPTTYIDVRSCMYYMTYSSHLSYPLCTTSIRLLLSPFSIVGELFRTLFIFHNTQRTHNALLDDQSSGGLVFTGHCKNSIDTVLQNSNYNYFVIRSVMFHSTYSLVMIMVW